VLDRGEDVGLDVRVVEEVEVLQVQGHCAVTAFLTIVEGERLELEVAAFTVAGG
jgi:hypothetical protein